MQTENESKSRTNLLVPDTNVLISDSDAINSLMRGGNTLYLPRTVLDELEGLKNNPNVGSVARVNLRKIETLQRKNKANFIIYQSESYSGLNKLDKEKNDHRIIATFNSLVRHRLQLVNGVVKIKKGENVDQFEKIKLVTNDTSMIILAREFFKDYGDLVSVEKYRRNRVRPRLEPIEKINLGKDIPEGIAPGSVFQLPEKTKTLKENDGVIIVKDDKELLAMRKASNLRILDPEISVAGGLKAMSLNGNGKNWHQILALHQLLDKGISCIFLEGEAGTGKTLLALAAAIFQKKNYESIVVIRPMVHLSDKDNVGFIKGSLEKKIFPWLKPIELNLKFIYNLMKKNEGTTTKNIQKKKKDKQNNENGDESLPTYFEYFNVQVETLDYIRGLTLPNIFAIIDEAQNLTPMQIKTIITRAGKGSKFVFTGDLSQIDVKYLTSETSGMAHAISKLHDKMPGSGSPMIATTIFTHSLRSPLAKLAVERLGHD